MGGPAGDIRSTPKPRLSQLGQPTWETELRQEPATLSLCRDLEFSSVYPPRSWTVRGEGGRDGKENIAGPTPPLLRQGAVPCRGPGLRPGPTPTLSNQSTLTIAMSSSDMNAPNTAGGADPAGTSGLGQRALPPVTPEEWERLRAPFSIDAYQADPWAAARPEGRSSDRPSGDSGEKGHQKAIVHLTLRAQAVRGRLDRVLGPGRYSYRLELASPGSRGAILCHLQVGRSVRTGVAKQRRELREVENSALARAAAAFGMGHARGAARPVLAKRVNRYDLPTEAVRRVEEREEVSPWTPDGEPPEAT